MAFQTLNKLKWTDKLDRCEVVIVHRVAENDRKTIPGEKITEVKKGYFQYKNTETREETTIPMHRVREIRVEGKTVWKK